MHETLGKTASDVVFFASQRWKIPPSTPNTFGQEKAPTRIRACLFKMTRIVRDKFLMCKVGRRSRRRTLNSEHLEQAWTNELCESEIWDLERLAASQHCKPTAWSSSKNFLLASQSVTTSRQELHSLCRSPSKCRPLPEIIWPRRIPMTAKEVVRTFFCCSDYVQRCCMPAGRPSCAFSKVSHHQDAVPVFL